MIDVRITEKDHRTVSLTVKGHANSDECGKDLVCAAVSAVSIGLCNAMYEICGAENITVDDNRVMIIVEKSSDTAETVMRTGIIQLKMLEERYPDFIKIKITEV
jgi:hypothetical protein